MDYSRGIVEDEQAPWGSSPPVTPRRNDTTFSSAAANDSGYGYGSQTTDNGSTQPEASEDPFKGPSDSAAADSGFGESQESEPSQQSGFGDPLDQPQQPQQQQQQAQPGFSQEQDAPQQQQQQQGQHEGQSHPQGQPVRRPTQPQYKLQAKITGLERTGRKDPILRFDVHVSHITQGHGRS